MTRIIAIAGRKGGSGKTTTAINLAGALAERGVRVALMDLDPQASLTRLLLAGAQPAEGIGARILEQRSLDGLATPLGVAGVDLYPGDRSIESAALALADNPTGALRLRKLVRPVATYDVILLDTPPALGFALNCHFARFMAPNLARSVAPCGCRFTRQNGPSGK
jgi:chromosome partitioning protein